jgi:hypothetical protein
VASPKNKQEFVERYDNGEFGNRPRSWSSWGKLKVSGYNGCVTIRNRDIAGDCQGGRYCLG